MFNLILAQYAITAISSGFNACYFFSYRSPIRRRRIGAVVLAVASAAIFIESVYFGSFILFQDQGWAIFLEPRYWLMAKLSLCVGSLLMSALIMRQLFSNRR